MESAEILIVMLESTKSILTNYWYRHIIEKIEKQPNLNKEG